MSLEEIFAEGNSPEKIIGILSGQKKGCPSWSALEKDFIPEKHEIVADSTRRPKTKIKNGKKEVPAKLVYPAEMIAARRMTQMAFSIPVKRVYSQPENESEKEFQKAIENVYDSVRIDGVNAKRMYAYFAGCEFATFWFVVEGSEEHDRYGFQTKNKIRCRTFTPMPEKYTKLQEAAIYHYYDDIGDMIALSFEYKDSEDIVHFDSYTAENTYYFTKGKGSSWEIETIQNPLGKIAGVYLWRPLPIYYGISDNRDEIEFTMSRTSDNIRKNTSPIMKIKGEIEGELPVGDTARQVYKLSEGGDVGLIAPALTTSDSKTHVEMLKQINSEITQLPDLSLENIRGINAISGEARKTLLADPHLRVMEESHDIIEAFDREFNVVKAIIAHEKPEWKKYVNTTTCKHVVTPFIQNDTTSDIANLTKANGGKPLLSQKTSVSQAGLVEDPDAEYELIVAEELQQAERERMVDLFTGAE